MADQGSPHQNDNPGVKLPPPLVYGGFLVLGICLQSNWINGNWGPAPLLMGAGTVFLIACIATIREAKRHHDAGTSVEPWKPTTVILDKGLYAYSRNPIYVGMTIAYASLALAAMSYLALAFLAFALLIIRYHVIARGEAYLEQKFGETYLSYKARVRRWI